MFVSEYFNTDLERTGAFDALLDKDSHFFINVIRLKKSTISEFVEAYQHMNQYFSDIATLLDAADEPNMKDKMYREARNRFHFHEVNGINLGFAESHWGSGWGDVISDQVLRDAYQIVKKGSKQPEIFHLVSLIEENVAGDRLSDMLATIIEPYIISYTLRIMKELEITPVSHPELLFLANGLIQNPFKRVPILLLPKEILHELPIAKDWDDINRVASENRIIRREISTVIGEDWERWASEDQKRYLKDHIFMKPDVCKRVIDGYREEELDALDPREDPEYMAEILLKKIKSSLSFSTQYPNLSSFEATMAIIDIFRDWVENNRGWAEIQDSPTKKREKAVQRFVHLGAKYYVQVNNLDLSFESDEGRGPVDIKLSRGNDKTLAEIKLSSNSRYLHRYKAQVEEYGKAERTRKLIYVFVDVGNPGRLNTIKRLHANNKRRGVACPELVIVNANERRAASTYEDGDCWLGGIEWPEIELPETELNNLNWDIDWDVNKSLGELNE